MSSSAKVGPEIQLSTGNVSCDITVSCVVNVGINETTFPLPSYFRGGSKMRTKRHQHPRPPRDSLFLCLPRILRNEGAEGSTLHFREPFNESLLRARNVAQEGKADKEKEWERKYVHIIRTRDYCAERLYSLCLL